MMKKLRNLLTGLALFLAFGSLMAQAPQDCAAKYSLFKGNVKGKRFAEAKPDLDYLMQKCPKLSVNIYRYGERLAKGLKDADLMKKVYDARLINYPNKEVAQAHDSYATFLIDNELGTATEIQSLLEKAYALSPKDMSVKNIYMYFDGVFNTNKESNTQLVFDTYDNVLESVEEKLAYYATKMVPLLKKEEAKTLTPKETRYLESYKANSTALGQVKTGLDIKIETIATCERLIPMLTKKFDANKADATWLRRSVKRLNRKGCQSDPLYEKLARTFVKVKPSAIAYNFLAGILESKGNIAEGTKMRKKAFDLETDPIKKAKLKYQEAFDAKRAGRKGRARTLAYEALKYNPNMGQAYLLIADLYARSANSCGGNEFQKRMVYLAALNKARKAKSVDSSCGAGAYILNYSQLAPSKTLIFQQGVKGGSSHKIGCWIGETVKVPNL